MRWCTAPIIGMSTSKCGIIYLFIFLFFILLLQLNYLSSYDISSGKHVATQLF